jgi:hypothetical protein
MSAKLIEALRASEAAMSLLSVKIREIKELQLGCPQKWTTSKSNNTTRP